MVQCRALGEEQVNLSQDWPILDSVRSTTNRAIVQEYCDVYNYYAQYKRLQ